MRKFLSLFLMFVLIFSFSSCGTSPQNAATSTSSPACESVTTTPTLTTAENTGFSVHYIDVGQGDAALVLCDDMSMLIDGGKPKASDVIYTYLKNQGITCLDYLICSHPDDDHIGGLSAPLSTLTVKNVYAPDIEANSRSYQSFKQKAAEQGLTIQHPVCGDSLKFGSSTIDFLGPVTVSADDKNNSSIVMKIKYGETSFLFVGDAEREEEQQILDKGFDLSATVLKVGHHGSRNSTTYPFLREIMPEYAVISVGDNSYGHPTEDVLSRLRDADVKVYRTDMQGDIIAVSDGKTVSITTKKNETAVTNPTIAEKQPEETKPNIQTQTTCEYIGNRNTKKFHYPNCRSVSAMSEKNKDYLNCTRDEAIQQGYDPCSSCKP